MSNLQTADIGLGQTILRRAAISPDKPAITFEGHTQTFAELGDRVRRMAAVLRAGGISTGLCLWLSGCGICAFKLSFNWP